MKPCLITLAKTNIAIICIIWPLMKTGGCSRFGGICWRPEPTPQWHVPSRTLTWLYCKNKPQGVSSYYQPFHTLRCDGHPAKPQFLRTHSIHIDSNLWTVSLWVQQGRGLSEEEECMENKYHWFCLHNFCPYNVHHESHDGPIRRFWVGDFFFSHSTWLLTGVLLHQICFCAERDNALCTIMVVHLDDQWES